MTARSSPLLLFPALCLWMGLLCAAASSPVAMAQQIDDATSDELTFGFQVFHSLLESRGARTETDLQVIWQDPANSILVLLGDVQQNGLLVRSRLPMFLEQGGCVLLATDRAAWADQLCVIQRGPVLVDEQFAYQGHRDCPRITQLHESHPLTAGVGELIGNRSGALASLFPDEGRWQVLAALPLAADDDRESSLLAVLDSRHSRRGGMVALADHSLLINGMVLHGDNARFQLNLTNWLSRDGRSQLFIAVDGIPLAANGQPSALPNELPPLPPPEDLPKIDVEDLKNLPTEMWLPFANQLLLSMEDANIHNELAANRPRGLADRLYRRLLYLLAGVVALAWVARQLVRRAQRVDPPVQVMPRSLLAMRVEQHQRAGHLAAAMQALAADLLRAHCGSAQPSHWARATRDVRIDAGWLVRHRVKRALRKLCQLAAPTAPGQPLSSAEFRWLSRRIAEIQRLNQQRRLHWPAS